jgi:hypothetical protein
MHHKMVYIPMRRASVQEMTENHDISDIISEFAFEVTPTLLRLIIGMFTPTLQILAVKENDSRMSF